ncbi:MAG: hypothetical protein AABY91_02525 [Gemmatimonadota bacterium]
MESLIPIVVVPTVFAFILLIGPFRQPLTRWINRKADGGEGGMMLREELAEQSERLMETERRVMELEERLDFAERLLSSGRGPNPPSGDPPAGA